MLQTYYSLYSIWKDENNLVFIDISIAILLSRAYLTTQSQILRRLKWMDENTRALKTFSRKEDSSDLEHFFVPLS